MEITQKESESFIADLDLFLQWIQQHNNDFANNPIDVSSTDRLKAQIEAHKVIIDELIDREQTFEVINGAGETLKARSPKNEQKYFSEKIKNLSSEWQDFKNNTQQRSKELEEALVVSGQFEDGVAKLNEWIDGKLPTLERELNDNKFAADSESWDKIMSAHKQLEKEFASKKKPYEIVHQRVNQLITEGQEVDEQVGQDLASLDHKWKIMEENLSEKQNLLELSMTEALDLTDHVAKLKDSMDTIEARVKREASQSTDVDSEAIKVVNNIEEIAADLENDKEQYQRTLAIIDELKPKAHPAALENILKTEEQIQERFNQVSNLVDEKLTAANSRVEQLKKHNENMEKLELEADSAKEYMAHLEQRIQAADNIDVINELMREYDEFSSSLVKSQPEVEELVDVAQRHKAVVKDEKKGLKKPKPHGILRKRLLSDKRWVQ